MTTALTTGLRRVAARLTPDDTPDGDLLARYLAHADEAAFTALVRRHGAMVFGTCRRVLGNAADADDAFQAAFVVLLRRAAQFTDRASVGNFLYGVAFHSALKAKAMAAKRRLREAKAAPPPDAADDSELLLALDEELAKLPEKYREPVVLCELEGQTRRDAAAHLKVAEGTISSRLATAHRMLEKRLKARGFATAGVAALLANPSPAAVPPVELAAVLGPPPGVAQLVAEVSKMLFLSKLKLGAAVAFGIAVLLAAGAGALRPGPAAADEKPAVTKPEEKKKEPTAYEKRVAAEQDEAKKFHGRWVSKKKTTHPLYELRVAGKEATWEWTFGENGATCVSFLEGKEVSAVKARYVVNPHTTPKQLNIVGDRTLLLCLYELNGDKLKVALYGRSEVERPKSFEQKDIPNDAEMLIVIEFEREAEKKRKPANAAEEMYSLADGEVLKLIPAPFPEGRNEFVAARHAFAKPGELFGWYVFSANGESVKMRNGVGSGLRPTEKVGVSIVDQSAYLEYFVRAVLQLREDETFGLDPNLDGVVNENTRVHLDVVVRENATIEQLVPALQRELKEKCKIDLTFTYSHEEREVIRLSGKHTMNDPKLNRIDLFASSKMPEATIVQTISGSEPVAYRLSRFLDQPVVDESDLSKRSVPVRVFFHKRVPPTKETLAEDCDPEKVLKNFAEQTGLTVDRVKRKVRVLRATKSTK